MKDILYELKIKFIDLLTKGEYSELIKENIKLKQTISLFQKENDKLVVENAVLSGKKYISTSTHRVHINYTNNDFKRLL